jgi:rSAM/selenodomain-associated transferase 1
MRRTGTLMVVAKSPRPGHVKTRLCPPCRPEEAARLAEAALIDTLRVLAAVPARRHILALDGPAGPWLRREFVVTPQAGHNLAERLANALTATVGPVFLVGMDTPQLDSKLVANALETLSDRETDAVLGPAFDGGWWGIGLRRPDPRVFHGVEMSTDTTYAQQVARLAVLGLRTRELQPLRDVDTFDDAVAVAAVATGTRFAGTFATLEPQLRARVVTA